MLGSRQKLSFGWNGMEMCYFGEIKIEWKILILVLDSKVVVSTVILRTVSKSDILSADFDIRIAGSCHHLYFQIIELLFGCTWDSYWELNKCH